MQGKRQIVVAWYADQHDPNHEESECPMAEAIADFQDTTTRTAQPSAVVADLLDHAQTPVKAA
jgi:hypothetical protein